MKTTSNYLASEWGEVARVGLEVFLCHEDAYGGAIHGFIRGFGNDEETSVEWVEIRRAGSGAWTTEKLRVGLIAGWTAVWDES